MPVTVVAAAAVSSPSAVTLLAVTRAWSLTVPGVVAVTLIVMVTLVTAARVPAVQVTVPPLVFGEPLGVRLHEPCVAARPGPCLESARAG